MSPLSILLVLVGVGALLLAAQPHKLTLRAHRSWSGLLADQTGAIPFLQLSPDAQIRFTEFREEFMLALSNTDVEPWAMDLGLGITSSSLRTKYPISIAAAAFREFVDQVRYRKMFEKSLDLIPKQWADGVEELASVIEAPDFIGWANQPQAMALAAQYLPNEIIAGLLEANGANLFEDPSGGTNFFASVSSTAPVVGTGANAGKHPFNILDTSSAVGGFDNLWTGASTGPSIQNLQIAKTFFRKIKGPNGKPLGLRMTHVIAPPAQEEIWKDLLEQDMLIQALPLSTSVGTGAQSNSFGAVDNRHKGTVKLIIADQLTNDLAWYPLALNKPGMYPWIVQTEGTPEELVFDKSSDKYKHELKLALGYVLRANGALALSQCMQKWAGA